MRQMLNVANTLKLSVYIYMLIMKCQLPEIPQIDSAAAIKYFWQKK